MLSAPPADCQPGEETVLEAANRVGIPRGTLLCWLRQGKLRGRLTNVAARRIWLVQVSDVDLTLAGRTQPLMPDTWRNRSGTAGAAAALSPRKGVGLRAAARSSAKVW